MTNKYEDEVYSIDEEEDEEEEENNENEIHNSNYNKHRRKRTRIENDDDNDDDDNNNEIKNDNEQHNNVYSYDKKERKICKLFGTNLLKQALNNDWEDHEVAKLIMLIADELQFTSKSLYKFLDKSECSTPGIISILIDEGMEFTSSQIVSLLANRSDSTNSFISIINECLEQHIFDIKDEKTLEILSSYIENFSYVETQRFVTDICSHANSKKTCGKILNIFSKNLNSQEAASFIVSIVYLDFFQDIKGNMESFLSEIPLMRTEVEALLDEGHELNEDGEPIYSDEDENGNLKGFVCDDDDDDNEHYNDDNDEDDDNDNDNDNDDKKVFFVDDSKSPSPIVMKKNSKRRIIDDD